jgi:hypothetical protein
VREELLFNRCVFGLQAGDLGLKRGALVRHNLARPPCAALGADRYFAGAAIEPQIASIDTIEGVPGIVAFRRRSLRRSHRRRREFQSGNDA